MMIYFTLFYIVFMCMRAFTRCVYFSVIYLLIVNFTWVLCHLYTFTSFYFDWLLLLVFFLLKIGCKCVYYTNRDNLTYVISYTHCNRQYRNWVNLEQWKAQRKKKILFILQQICRSIIFSKTGTHTHIHFRLIHFTCTANSCRIERYIWAKGTER